GSSGSTPLAQGGMAAAVGPGDSPELHAADTLRAGDGLGDPQAVGVMSREGPARVADLIRRGAVFDHVDASPDAPLALAREGGQSVARSVRAADATGAEIFRALRAAARGQVVRLQGVACALAQTSDGAGVCGVWVLLDEAGTGDRTRAGSDLALIRGRAVVLATGGCGGLYGSTTNRDGATADGLALAYAAGAALMDVEFVQFHPTGLKLRRGSGRTRTALAKEHSAWRLLLTEALRGAGAVLRDADGRRFMLGRHPDAELAPRHIVTRAILEQPGGAWLDATRLPPTLLRNEFPTALAGVRRFGYDLAAEPVPVEPTQHYLIGGVVTDLEGRTSLPGLYAAGEVACTGVHGANRMAGNSLLQSCVFAHRTALALARTLTARDGRDHEPADPPPPGLGPPGGGPTDRDALRGELRNAMSAGAGPIRSAASLETTAKALDEVAAALGPVPSADRDGVELAHLLRVGRLVVRSARLRGESRGVHWREDHPASDPTWNGVHLRIQGPPLEAWKQR
ncbi:MAG: FAD-binding protein, partial [Nitriliruptorales bacterium]|nr:FAD-binding protein [Nitriliruptorales bacterium]